MTTTEAAAASPQDAAAATHDLTVRFGDVTAVDGLSLTVPRGSVYGFLGPNGAGKSTTIGAMLGYVAPDAGSVELLGEPGGHAVRRRVGVMPEDAELYPRLTARDHLRFAARSKDVAVDSDALLDRVGLADAADRRAGGYSTGMAKRLLLATALVGEPALLVLDEPTSGLDPNGARMVREVVRAQRDRGATVFFSSHVMGQVEAVCDTVGILQDGALVAEDDVATLSGEGGTRIRIAMDRVPDGLVERLRGLDGVTDAARDDAGVETGDGAGVAVRCRDGAAKLAALDAARDAADVTDFATTEPSLDDVFARLTEGDADAGEGPGGGPGKDPGEDTLDEGSAGGAEEGAG